jgi:hypothetical protein
LVSADTVKLFRTICCDDYQWHASVKGLKDRREIVGWGRSRRRDAQSWSLALEY